MKYGNDIRCTPLKRFWAMPLVVEKLALRFHWLLVCELAGDFEFRPHTHIHYELIVVESGQYRCLLNNKDHRLGPDEFIVLKPGDTHADFCSPPLRYIAIDLEVSRTLNNVPFDIFKPMPGGEGQRGRLAAGTATRLVERLETQEAQDSMFSPQLQHLIMEECFWRLMEGLPAASFSEDFAELSSERSFASVLTRLFAANLTGRLTVSDMACHLHMSESAFAHRCVEVVGMPPAKAFTRYRMGQAERMLKSSGMSVKAVSDFFGFSNQYHFSRLFKQCVGVSPSSFAKSQK